MVFAQLAKSSQSPTLNTALTVWKSPMSCLFNMDRAYLLRCFRRLANKSSSGTRWLAFSDNWLSLVNLELF